jgi:hypothetical protein
MKNKKRIAIFSDLWKATPTKADFEAYNTYILINQLSMFYALKDDDRAVIVLPYEIDNIAINNNVDTKLKKMMSQLVNNLPEKCWQQVVNKLHFKQ